MIKITEMKYYQGWLRTSIAVSLFTGLGCSNFTIKSDASWLIFYYLRGKWYLTFLILSNNVAMHAESKGKVPKRDA